VQLEFGDGVFSNMPKGNFRTFVRQSDSVTMPITPSNFPETIINIPYVDRNGRQQILTLTLTLTNSYNNGSETESNSNIQNNAPLQYYSQNRMITGEDYTVFPLTINQNIVKAKAINRTASGISKYLDIIDPTQKYSSTTTFASDGYIYKEDFTKIESFTFTTINDIRSELLSKVQEVMGEVGIRNFYLDNYEPIDVSDMDVTWHLSTETNTGVTGYFLNALNNPQVIGNFTSSNLKFIESDCFLKFISDPITTDYQNFTGDGVETTFSLAANTTLSTNAQVFVDDELQLFGVDYYTNSGRTVVNFITAPINAAEIKILPEKLYFTPNGIIVPSNTIQEGYTDIKWISVVKIVGDGTNNGTGDLLSGLGPIELNGYLANTAKLSILYPKMVGVFYRWMVVG